MKKTLCVFLTLFLLASSAAMAEGAAILNPNGYDLLKVTDIFTNSDSEYNENDEEIPHAETLFIQGSFGTIHYPADQGTESAGESEGMELVGFEMENTVSLTLAENCEIWMPTDVMNPVENAKTDDLQAWYDAASAQMAEFLAEGESSYSFYALFEMNGDGALTKLEYCYFDWN